jgi:hypothetical protein
MKTKYLIILLFTILVYNCSPDKREWKNVKQLDSISLYENFIENYPNSEYVDSAIFMIEKIKLNRIDRIISINNIETYQNYLDSFSIDIFKDAIKNRLKLIYPPLIENRLYIVDGLSEIIGNGEVEITKGDSTYLKVKFKGTSPIKHNEMCWLCMSTIKIDPFIKVAVEWFLSEKKDKTFHVLEQDQVSFDLMQPEYTMTFHDVVLNYEGKNAENNYMIMSTPSFKNNEYIVTGKEGATLKKSENGFTLIKGTANYFKK